MQLVRDQSRVEKAHRIDLNLSLNTLIHLYVRHQGDKMQKKQMRTCSFHLTS